MNALRMILLGGLVFLARQTCALEMTVPPESYFVGSWVGLSPGNVFTYRLELHTNLTGRLASLYRTNVVIYNIKRWEFRDKQLRLQVAAPPQDNLSVKSRWEGTQIGLQIRGDGWRDSVSLSREEELGKKLALLKRAMADPHRSP